MAETVYLLGAGVNRGIQHATRDIRPPLAKDLFQQLHYGLKKSQLDVLVDKNPELYKYIETYWKLSASDLTYKDFDLEECFTLLDQQEKDMERTENYTAWFSRSEIKGQLAGLLAELIEDISSNRIGDGGLRDLANRIHRENASVLTFNYDTLLEQFMSESCFGWDPLLAYSVDFSYLEHHSGGPSGPYEEFFDFRTYYSSTKFEGKPFLKLHGSLNWFGGASGSLAPMAAYRKNPNLVGQIIVRRIDSPRMKVAARNIYMTEGRTLLEPLIITPVLYKDYSARPFAQIWKRAQEELKTCSRLIVCGYSFPPTDFAGRRLFLESFENSSVEELIVINPDTSIVGKVKELCHFRGPVLVSGTLEEFVSS